MGRQLFIHHYLPSHLASALLAGSVLSFILSDTINFPISLAGRWTKMKHSEYADLGMRGPVAVGGFAFIMFLMFLYMAPLTYGTPG
jgi:dolichyl-phosphate-mannose-protein mannosyltransferase